MTVNAFAPQFAAPGRPPRSSRESITSATPSRWANNPGAISPACGTRFGSSKLTDHRLKS